MRSDIDDFVQRTAIERLIQGWGLWRDTAQWQRLLACYAPGALMRTTWFDGTATDFVAASQRMASGGGPSVQHFIGASSVALHSDRALAVTRIQLLVRGRLGDTPVDVTCYGRFHDRLVRLNGDWLIERREPVYDKDCLQAVLPQDALFIDPQALALFPAHYAFTAFLQSRGGATITMDLPAPNSPADLALRDADAAWLSAPISATLASA